MKLSPGKFNAHLRHMGQNLTWRRAFDCPCKDPHSGASDPGCALCSANGRIWNTSVAGYAGVTGQKTQREWAQHGLWENGDMVLSLPSNSPVYAMGENDRVIMTDSSVPFSTTRTRTGTESLVFPVSSIDKVFWLVAGAMVNGAIPTVSAAGLLTWASGGPPSGAQYSITGRKNPEYFMFASFPQDRAHHGGAKLPRLVVMRLFDLYGRSGR